MILRTMNTLMSQVLTSLRFTTFSMWMAILSFTVMPVSFYVAAHWGTGAVAAAWLLLSPVTVLPPAVKLFRAIHCRLGEYLAILAPAIVASAAMLGAVLGLRLMLPAGLSPLLLLVTQVAAGGAIYCGILLGFYRERILKYVQFFTRLRQDRDVLAAEKL
jgi:hypothetical protein